MAIDTAIGHSICEVAARGNLRLLEVRKPKECALAMEMLASGEPYAAIKAATGLSYESIGTLRVRHEDAIAVRREKAADEAEHLADVYREVLRRKAEMLLDDPAALARMNPKDAALTLGILTDKSMVLRGDATAVVEHKKGLGIEDAARLIEAARRKVQGEAIDV